MIRKKENRKKKIGHGHVNNQEINRLSQSFCLKDNQCNEGISNQRNKKEQAVSKGFTDSCRCGVEAARRGLCSIHRCSHVFWHSWEISSYSVSGYLEAASTLFKENKANCSDKLYKFFHSPPSMRSIILNSLEKTVKQ